MRPVIFLTTLFYLLNASQVSAMSFGPKVCLASELTLTVLDNGKPVVGARVIREYEELYGKEKSGEQSAITDVNGQVIFPAIWNRTFLKFLPFENRIIQKVTIEHLDESKPAIEIVKYNYDEWGELNNKYEVKSGKKDFLDYKFQCDLSDTPRAHMKQWHGQSRYFGICQHTIEFT